jgi:hypothetical protein
MCQQVDKEVYQDQPKVLAILSNSRVAIEVENSNYPIPTIELQRDKT